MSFDYSLWPNPDGNLGVKKVAIPDGVTVEWPDGDALVGKFVYKDGKLVGFVDNKALTVNDSKSTTFPYDYVNIQVDKSLESVMSFNKGERTKYLTISYTTSGNGGSETFDFVIIDFNTTDAETINTVRTAKRVVDNKLYDANDGLIGTIDTSKIEVGGNFEIGDGLFCNNGSDGTERGLILSEFNSDLNSLRDGSGMFVVCSNLTTFNSDLSSLTDGSCMFIFCSNLTSFTPDLSSLTNGLGMFYYSGLESFNSDLYSLTNGSQMFQGCSNLTSFTSDLSSLTDGYRMFINCYQLTSFTSDSSDSPVNLSSLTNGENMFSYCTNLNSFTSDLSSLTNGYGMFNYCTNLTTFNSDLSSLTDGSCMFILCSNLTSFTPDLSSLTNGNGMFAGCKNLTSFNSDLSSLTNGDDMFSNCKLDTPSVQNIANTINTVSSGKINIGIGTSIPIDQAQAAFNTIASKGWTVYVNGSQYTPTSLAAITTLDENGEEIITPIPFYAKPVPATEETASYVDANGNFFNIVGGQFIYGDDISTYGMFTCEEDAAANMRLTKYERPEETEKTNPLLKLKNVLKPILTQEEKKAKLMELFGRNKS